MLCIKANCLSGIYAYSYICEGNYPINMT
uniref:Uncharacterized protein n=1 Tax=Arundo donax TaxID=35708 RepID=A0A0A9H224_ARUDO